MVDSLRNFAIVTATYWAFTITDGALRMLVLLFLHEQGYSPLALASLFILYECCGVATNLLGGWLGSRFGLNSTLLTGLSLQIVACASLAIAASDLTVPFVMGMQALSGVAKDLTKMSSKSYVKLVVPEGDGDRLMRWVSLITGSKNALKGVGFFLGGALLAAVGFRGACLGMAIALAASLVLSATLLPRKTGRVGAKARIRGVFSIDPRINWLAAARLLLFGSRDVWFVIALPVFLAKDLGWSFAAVGGFLASWVIGYGFVQANAPRALRVSNDGHAAGGSGARRLLGFTWALVVPLAGVAAALDFGLPATSSLVFGLALFGIVFAVNSALHSYLIVAYADAEKVAMNVGFYYSANAVGRLIGTILSGAVFQIAGTGRSGLVACIGVSISFVLLSGALCLPLVGIERREPAEAS